MGLVEGYFVPLYSFFPTPSSFEQKVHNVAFAFSLMTDAGLPKPKARPEGESALLCSLTSCFGASSCRAFESNLRYCITVESSASCLINTKPPPTNFFSCLVRLGMSQKKCLSKKKTFFAYYLCLSFRVNRVGLVFFLDKSCFSLRLEPDQLNILYCVTGQGPS